MADYKGFRVPEWHKKGYEPSEEMKESGWKISQKPPAEYFNWFFSSTYDSIKKLIDDQDTHSKLTNNPHKVTAGQVGAYTKEQTDEAIKLNVPEIDTSDLASKKELENHKNDTSLHTSAEEKNKWNNHEKDKNIHVELKEKEKWNNHVIDISKHVTEEDKNNWNNKFDSENEQYKKDQQALKDYISSEIEKQSSEWFGTLEEYEALETKDNKTIYYIHD